MEPHVHHVNVSRYIQTTEGTHSLLVWIIIGLIAGYLTGKIMRGAGFGPLVDIIVGVIGAIIGGLIMITLGYAGTGGFLYTVFVAVIGAVILTLILRLLTAGRFRNF
ncbi:MAG TPA: GlsB/YeaQ/YmgE family stress response membrane protein [Candidatus Aquilonibacter sp.]|nr:GlsB/YeaQ/YmgE family stress response membrane protein [Candidatus Aquilonibacter sp.]